MIIDSNDEESPENDYSNNGDDADVDLNHYRIPKLSRFGFNGTNNPPKGRKNCEQISRNKDGSIMSLTELAAQRVACYLSFGQVEQLSQPVPELIQCRIAFWSFPQDEEDIRLYTCLANGNAEVFVRAEDLYKKAAVSNVLQIGFHLNAEVKNYPSDISLPDISRVAIKFDRRRITSCTCTCLASWCEHIVAVCLHRIRKPLDISLKAPVSETLHLLSKEQLQKFAQYLINEWQQILPSAQTLLDELLDNQTEININSAAPDPTAGATVDQKTTWCLDYTHLESDISEILKKQCSAQPTVCSDIQSLDASPPPASTEYSQLLRPIRGREPEGLWNLISIVGEMMKRRDTNFLPLLEFMTDKVLRKDKIITWWFETKVSLYSGSTIHSGNNKSSPCTNQYSCSNVCDEIVHLWRLAAMNPNSSQLERERLYQKFFDWHLAILKAHSLAPDGNGQANIAVRANKRNLLELFPGFKASMESCLIKWNDWDEKRGKIITVVEEPETQKTKSARGNKKRKKKSKLAKQLDADSKQLTSNEDHTVDDEVSESRADDVSQEVNGIDHDLADENQDNILEEEIPPHDVERAQVEDQVHDRQIDEADDLNEQLEDLDIGQVDNREANGQAGGIEQDLRVYYMDRSAKSPVRPEKPECLEDYIKVNTRKLNDPLETLYAKTEGLHAHGYITESRTLAHRVATQILSSDNYPSAKQLYSIPRKKRKRGSLDNQMSIVASETLTKITFLSNVLLDDIQYHNLLFKLVLFGVKLKRSPAATKPLEVKLINQKQELLTLIRCIALRAEELEILRDIAKMVSEPSSDQCLDPLTTLMLGDYLFEVFVLAKPSSHHHLGHANHRHSSQDENQHSQQPGQYHIEHLSQPQAQVQAQPQAQPQQQPDLNQQQPQNLDQLIVAHAHQASSLIVLDKLATDVNLGFQAALDALSVKINIHEADHPLLCEGIRRYRGQLALSLLTYFKDDREKLDLILKHLLDEDVILSTKAEDQASVDATSIKAPAPSKRNTPSLDPNPPTEASAHFMFVLAKTVFEKAGGDSLTAHLFRPQLAQNGARGIHRNLHMCTLRIALYALGLQNRTSHNWMQRTYNGRASFIHEQTLEIGLPAIEFLCDNWQGYLTPVEAASIADKAGCSNDEPTKKVAADLAKSCLKFANFLDFNAVSRILAQCRDQSIEMIEAACYEIEQVAENDSVCADVLFATARAWYDLYYRSLDKENSDNLGVINFCQTSQLHRQQQIYPDQQDTGAADWSRTNMSSMPHNAAIYQNVYDGQQFIPPTIHPMQYDVYARYSFMTESMPISSNFEYVKSAYRVGMKALDALKLSLHLGSKHNPKKMDEILWLLELTKMLDRDALHNFSRSAIRNITDPHILHIIIEDNFFETLPEIDRITILLPIIDKCLDRCVKQIRDLMKHLSYDQRSHVETIIDIAQDMTRRSYTLTAAYHFKELLKIVDNRKIPKKHRMPIETRDRHRWVDGLISSLKLDCTCTKCRSGGGFSFKYSTCSHRA